MGNGEKGYNRHVASMDDLPVTQKEIAALEGAVTELDKRVGLALSEHLPDLVKKAVHETMEGKLLSPEEVQWTKLAIQREAQSIKLRQALIEKSLTGLIWAGIAGLGIMVKEYLQAKGLKL